ncbi:MAG: UDP-N-acetylmuramoyl-tripeptide--D-alanyl-D-alanine ligase [Acidobacteriota bacterium]
MNAAAPKIDPALLQRETTSFVIDSREVKAGDVFFALSQPEYQNNGFNGDFDDATKFAASALEKGAAACVMRSDRYAEHKTVLAKYDGRLVFVDDAILALQRLAHGVYLDWNKPIVALTGSAGKTTAKELTAHILASTGRKILRNIKNYNNGLGHPLTVLNLAKDETYDVAVLEMGMSTPMHEIQRLCRITPPDVAVELNVLPVHVGHLGSIENVAKAKAELVEGMKPSGTAVLNADDDRVLAMRDLVKGKTMTYAIDTEADVRASNIYFARFGETTFTLTTPTGTAAVRFPLNGRHNILNALAAAAVGHNFGMSAEAIASSLASVEPPPQRGEVLHFADGFTVINDSYNSNPTALLSMTQTLVEGAGEKSRKIVVAGEMLELGENEKTIHRQIGAALGRSGINMLIGVRALAAELVEGAKDAGLTDSVFAENSDAAGELLMQEIRPGDVVLIKGSRGVRTEKVLEKLLEKYELEGKE